jgi:hypothetical protein
VRQQRLRSTERCGGNSKRYGRLSIRHGESAGVAGEQYIRSMEL